MRWNKDDHECSAYEYQIELDGVPQEGAVLADDKEGWVDVCKQLNVGWNVWKHVTSRKYGKVHIVKILPPISANQ